MTGKIITVAQQKGGSGKTTLCVNLATALASQRPEKRSTSTARKIAILDTDPQRSLGQWYMVRCEKLGDTNTNLQFRTASAWGARFEARELAKSHDIVIVDTPPKMGVDGRPSIETADLVLLPLTASPLDVWATQPTQELALGEKKPVLAVLNRVLNRSRIAEEVSHMLTDLNLPCAQSRLSNRVLYAQSIAKGLGVGEMRPSSPAAKEVAALAIEIEKLL